MKKKYVIAALLSAVAVIFSMTCCSKVSLSADSSSGSDSYSVSSSSSADAAASHAFTYSMVPPYDGVPSVKINDDKPFFDKSALTLEPFENYSKRDELGRCGAAYANVCRELMPTETRGVIGSIHPTGWHTVKYAGIEGNYLYNRCHLIAYRLTGENDNEDNLITGTRYMNVDGMQPYETQVSEYVESTGHHVHYRATPVFFDDDLLARGVLIEAQSVEDDKIHFCRFCYNVQPGIIIDYSDGSSNGPEFVGSDAEAPAESKGTSEAAPSRELPVVSPSKESRENVRTYILNTNTNKFHYPECESVPKIKDKNKKEVEATREEIIAQGYEPCQNCDP
jgi:DNA-entry nuclease